MTTKKDIITIYLLLIIELLILFKSKIIIKNVYETTILFVNSIMPSIFPNMVISNMMIKQDISKVIPNKVINLFNKLFNFNKNVTTLFIISFLTGTPTNIININEYENKGLITEIEAEYLSYITHFINPLFVISIVGIGIFNSVKIGLLLLLMQFISNIIKAFIFKNKFNKATNKTNNFKDKNIIDNFKDSINLSINSILIIFGIIVMFNILIILISNIFKFKFVTNVLISVFLEITSGISKLKYLNINNILKFIICYISLNFGGICIHMQSLSISKNKKIRYLKYLIFRII